MAQDRKPAAPPDRPPGPSPEAPARRRLAEGGVQPDRGGHPADAGRGRAPRGRPGRGRGDERERRLEHAGQAAIGRLRRPPSGGPVRGLLPDGPGPRGRRAGPAADGGRATTRPRRVRAGAGVLMLTRGSAGRRGGLPGKLPAGDDAQDASLLYFTGGRVEGGPEGPDPPGRRSVDRPRRSCRGRGSRRSSSASRVARIAIGCAPVVEGHGRVRRPGGVIRPAAAPSIGPGNDAAPAGEAGAVGGVGGGAGQGRGRSVPGRILARLALMLPGLGRQRGHRAVVGLDDDDDRHATARRRGVSLSRAHGVDVGRDVRPGQGLGEPTLGLAVFGLDVVGRRGAALLVPGGRSCLVPPLGGAFEGVDAGEQLKRVSHGGVLLPRVRRPAPRRAGPLYRRSIDASDPIAETHQPGPCVVVQAIGPPMALLGRGERARAPGRPWALWRGSCRSGRRSSSDAPFQPDHVGHVHDEHMVAVVGGTGRPRPACRR